MHNLVPPITAMLVIATFFLMSACVVDRHTMKLDMCKATVAHYKGAHDDIEAKAYFDYYMELCHGRVSKLPVGGSLPLSK